jgi:hypothetical protein
VKANLKLFIRLRNKIEHRNIEKRELDVLLFGECQALLMNFENLLVDLFGPDYALNENLAYALQFSTMRTPEQTAANRRALSADLSDIRAFITNYRGSLTEETFSSQSYSIKLIQIPKISNTNRNDVAIEFVRWNELSHDDRQLYDQLDVLIKDRVIKQPVVNLGGMKPGKVLEEINRKCGANLSHHDHKCLYVTFVIRPDGASRDDPFQTNPKYCHYDEVHDDYVYTQHWVDFLVSMIRADTLKQNEWLRAYKESRTYDIEKYN